MLKEIFILGIGGQGALTVGEILCNAGNRRGYSVSFYPFYGSQMRGGEAGCVVKMDTEGEEIANPTINEPEDFILLSDRFFEKYRRFAGEEARFFRVSAGAEEKEDETSGITLQVPPNDKNLNLKMLRRYIDETGLFDEETMLAALKERFRNEAVYAKKKDIYLGVGK